MWERKSAKGKKEHTREKGGQDVMNKYSMKKAEVKVFSHLFSPATVPSTHIYVTVFK